MTQEQLIIDLFKVDLIADIVAVVLFTVVYSLLAPWWRNPIGRTLVVMDILVGAAVCPSVLSLFWSFNRLTSLIAAWADVAVFGAIALVILARIPLWIGLHKNKDGTDDAGGSAGSGVVSDQ